MRCSEVGRRRSRVALATDTAGKPGGGEGSIVSSRKDTLSRDLYGSRRVSKSEIRVFYYFRRYISGKQTKARHK